MDERLDVRRTGRVGGAEGVGSDANGRKIIAWGRWIGCRDAGHGFGPGRGVYTRLLVDAGGWCVRTPLVPFVPTRANPCGLAPFCAVFRRIVRSFETRAIRAKSCGLENETWTDRVRFPRCALP